MAETKERETRLYKVLIPRPPTADDFSRGQSFVNYLSLGEFEAATPDEAIDYALDDVDGVEDLVFDQVDAVPVRSWQSRTARSSLKRVWELSRVETVDDPPPPKPKGKAQAEPEPEPEQTALGDEARAKVEKAGAKAAEAAEADPAPETPEVTPEQAEAVGEGDLPGGFSPAQVDEAAERAIAEVGETA